MSSCGARSAYTVTFFQKGLKGHTMTRIVSMSMVFLFFAIQSICLISHFAIDIAPYPPEASDQALYLTQAYSIAAQGLRAVITNPLAGNPQSALFFSEGAVLELIFRSPRFSALLLNFLMLVAAEVFIFFAVKRSTESVGLGLIGVAFLTSAHTLWFWAGGIFDYRIDWLASCAYGIWCCSVLQSRIFADRKWTSISVLAACFLILNRYITVTYVLGIEIVLFGIIICTNLYTSSFKRAVNLGLAQIAQIAIILPFVIRSWPKIQEYYIVGHLTGDEKQIRAKEFGVNNLVENFLYYPRSLLSDHLGTPFFYMLAAFAAVAIASWIWSRRSTAPSRTSRFAPLQKWLEGIFLIGAISAPLVVLTSDLSKSPVVAGVVDIPVILLITLLPSWIGIRFTFPSVKRRSVDNSTALSILFVAAGLVIQIHSGIVTQRITQRADLQKWDLNVEAVVLDALGENKNNFIIGANVLSPHFIPPVFSAMSYELGHRGLSFDLNYKQTIFAPEVDEYLDSFRKADYAILSTSPRPAFYPISRFMAEHDKEVRSWVEDHMDKILEISFDGGVNQTYKRRPELLQTWLSGSYGQERINERVFQWEGSDATLQVSKSTTACMTLAMFGMGGAPQSIRVTSDLGLDRVVDLTGTDIWHPVSTFLPIAPPNKQVTFTFHALAPAGHFPNDAKEIAFGADQAHAANCPPL